MRELDKEGRSPRYVAFISLVTLVFLIFIGRLFAIQILEASKYEERALQNRIRTNVIKATRGEIYDRDGKLLAKNITGYMLVHYATKQIDPTDVKILREIQSFNMDQIRERLSKEKKSRNEKLLETIIDIKKIWNQLNLDSQSRILNIFGLDIEKLKLVETRDTISFTQPFSEDKVISEDEKVDLYKKIKLSPVFKKLFVLFFEYSFYKRIINILSCISHYFLNISPSQIFIYF